MLNLSNALEKELIVAADSRFDFVEPFG